MSGSYSPPLPLVHLKFRYLSQTKHLCFLQTWGNKGFLLEAVTSTNRSNKSQGWQIEGESRITWHTDETSLPLSAPSPRAAVEGRCWSLWWPAAGSEGMEWSWIRPSSDWTLEKRSSLGGWLVTGTGFPGTSLAPGHGTKPAKVQGAPRQLWLTLSHRDTQVFL